MSRDPSLRGVYIPLITPFESDGSVALGAIERLAHECLDAGAAGLVPLGTTGESPFLDAAEKRAIVELCAGIGRERDVHVIVGVGTNNTPGTIAAAAHHGLTLPAGAVAGVKGGFLGSVLHVYPSEMAQNFWTAIFAWSTCFVVTLLVSSLTAPRPEKELGGLVYSLTPRPKEDGVPLYKQPGPLAIVVLLLTVVLNVIFW